MEWIIMNDELMHEGKPGMHWGINKYQTKSGKWTPLGLKRRREREGFGGKKKATPSSDAQKRAANKNEIKNIKSKSELESAKTDYKVSKYENKKRIIDAKNGTIASKLANKVKEDKEARAAAKKEKTAEEIIRSGDMKTVLKNKEKLSNEDLAKAIDRMRLEQGLSSVSDAKKQQGVDAYRRVADVVGITANLTTQGINAYNNIAKIMNTVGGKDMKIIGDKGPSAYDQAMNALKLRQARANADLTEMRLEQARNAGQNQNSSSSSSSSQPGTSSSSPTSSSSSSSQTGTSTSASQQGQTSSPSAQTGTHATATQQGQMTGAQLRRLTTAPGRWTQQSQDIASRRATDAGRTNQRLRDLRLRVASAHGTDSDEYRRVEAAERASEIVFQHTSNQYAELNRRNPTGQTVRAATRNAAVNAAHRAAEGLRNARLTPAARRAARDTAAYRAQQAAQDIDRAYDTLTAFNLTDYERRYNLRDDH